MRIIAYGGSRDLSTWEGGRVLRQECGFWCALAGWHDRISDWHGNFRHRVISEMSLPHDNAIVGQVVEAANERIVAKRFKGSGMRWSMEGGQAIKTLRALTMSGRFDRAWTALEANDNAKPTRETPCGMGPKRRRHRKFAPEFSRERSNGESNDSFESGPTGSHEYAGNWLKGNSRDRRVRS